MRKRCGAGGGSARAFQRRCGAGGGGAERSRGMAVRQGAAPGVPVAVAGTGGGGDRCYVPIRRFATPRRSAHHRRSRVWECRSSDSTWLTPSARLGRGDSHTDRPDQPANRPSSARKGRQCRSSAEGRTGRSRGVAGAGEASAAPPVRTRSLSRRVDGSMGRRLASRTSRLLTCTSAAAGLSVAFPFGCERRPLPTLRPALRASRRPGRSSLRRQDRTAVSGLLVHGVRVYFVPMTHAKSARHQRPTGLPHDPLWLPLGRLQQDTTGVIRLRFAVPTSSLATTPSDSGVESARHHKAQPSQVPTPARVGGTPASRKCCECTRDRLEVSPRQAARVGLARWWQLPSGLLRRGADLGGTGADRLPMMPPQPIRLPRRVRSARGPECGEAGGRRCGVGGAVRGVPEALPAREGRCNTRTMGSDLAVTLTTGDEVSVQAHAARTAMDFGCSLP